MHDIPRIVTEIPGPKGRSIVERQGKYALYRLPTPIPIVWSEAHGAVVTDVDGNRYIDFSSGVSVMNAGHSHPVVVESIKQQAERITHSYFAPTEALARCYEALAGILPASLRNIVLVNTGAEGVETAVKLARLASRKTEIISFWGSFHGKSCLTMAIGGQTNVKRGLGPLPSGHLHAPYAYCYRCTLGLERDSCGMQCLHYLDDLLVTGSQGDPAALIVEPYLGAGGSVVPPSGFLEGLRRFCDRNSILLIFDEVQSSFGRTGKMFAFEHGSFLPDIAILGKGIASGLPAAAVVVSDSIAETLRIPFWPSTFANNPLTCAAITASIEVLVEEDLPAQAARTGAWMLARLQDMQARYPLIGEARGIGMSMGVEFVRDRRTKEPACAAAKQVFELATRSGLVLLPPGGLYGNVLRVVPPLGIDQELADRGLDLFEAAVRGASAQPAVVA